MNYELAKELKEAGFPQSGWGNRIHPDGNFTDKNIPQPEPNTCYVPTLSELIEACGYNLAIEIEKDKCKVQRYGEGRERVTAEGKTPKESIAKLWLALNNK